MKKVFGPIFNYLRFTDLWLWLLCFGFSAFSPLMIYGIVRTNMIPNLDVRKVVVQAVAALIGTVVAVIVSKFDYHTLTKLWKLHATGAYTLVLLTFVFGTGTAERLGDKSWFRLPMGLTLQPSELLKISFILTLAYHLYVVREQINRPFHLFLLCLHGALPVMLIHVQGDDGSAIIFACIFVGMMFAAGLSWKYILPAGLAGILSIPFLWFFLLNDYQRQRFLAVYNPKANPLSVIYQQYNARLAIGSGQIWGKGIFDVNHKYVPAVHTDFIFAFIGESLGFVGCIAVVTAFIFLCSRIIADGFRSQDFQGRLICVGVFVMIAAQSIINIGMCISVLPVIGITLPFLSAGGTSVVITYMGIGLVLSVYMHTTKSMFD